MYRYELSDVHWAQIASFFPDCYHHGRAGHPWKEHRLLVKGILWRLHTGAPWADVPERYGPWKTAYDRFNRWCQDGTWAKILDALLLRLDKAGFIDRALWLVDASIIRASRAAAGAKKTQAPQPTLAGPEAWSLCEPPDHALGRSQGGFGTKVHLRRNLIERVIGWYKEYRALGTRYEKLAVNYVALWLLAMIDKLLRKYAQRLQTGLSDRA